MRKLAVTVLDYLRGLVIGGLVSYAAIELLLDGHEIVIRYAGY